MSNAGRVAGYTVVCAPTLDQAEQDRGTRLHTYSALWTSLRQPMPDTGGKGPTRVSRNDSVGNHDKRALKPPIVAWCAQLRGTERSTTSLNDTDRPEPLSTTVCGTRHSYRPITGTLSRAWYDNRYGGGVYCGTEGADCPQELVKRRTIPSRQVALRQAREARVAARFALPLLARRPSAAARPSPLFLQRIFHLSWFSVNVTGGWYYNGIVGV